MGWVTAGWATASWAQSGPPQPSSGPTLSPPAPIQARISGLTGEYSGAIEAFYPEGPLREGKSVLFAEMHRDRVVRWNGTKSTTFFSQEGCGPTAIARYGSGYVVLCHLTNSIHTVTREGVVQSSITRDTQGRPFQRPNDAGRDAAGGVYFSASGKFSRLALPEGALMYLGLDGRVKKLAERLRYTNGIVVAGGRVLVSEHLANRILAFPILDPGVVGAPEVFADLNAYGLGMPNSRPIQGPDGLEVDSRGNVYVAHYGAGEVLIFSPDGTLRYRVGWTQPAVTSLTLSPDESRLVVTGSSPVRGNSWPGRVEWIDNPAR